jgi:hypothetical protein
MVAITEAVHASLASHPQYFQAQQYDIHSQSQQSDVYPHQNYDFTNQPYANHAAPWNSEQPPRNPNVPRSSISFFDPATDPTDYTPFVPRDVNFWAVQNTDPAFLLSPNEPVSPQDFFPVVTPGLIQQQRSGRQPSHSQGHVHSQTFVSDSSPVAVRFHEASPAPDSHNFVTYPATGNHAVVTQRHISPIATSIELPVGRTIQSPASPLVSASSPGGSEGMFSSYQHSDTGLDHHDSQAHQSFTKIIPPPSPVEGAFSPSRTLLDSSTGVSPDPEGQSARRQVGPIRTTGRPGGRALGTHLEPKVAKAAHDMRKIVACWHCVLQRDKVTSPTPSRRGFFFYFFLFLTSNSAVLVTPASVV